jgi:hypothetical protein
MELMSIRMFMEIMTNTLMPDDQSPYFGMSPEKRLDAFSKAFDGYKNYLDSNCKPVKILIEETLKEVNMSNVTDKLLEDIENDVFPVCILFAMG